MSNDVILPLVITDAGRAALVNARNTGSSGVIISEIALGSGLWSPTATTGGLKNEVKRVSSFGGEAVAPDTIHVSIQDYTTDEYTLGEFGLYTDTGVLFAIYSQLSPILEKDAGGILLLASDIVLTSPDAQNVTINGDGISLPPATETVKGLIELATQAETDGGADKERAIVPARLKAWWDKVRLWENIKNIPAYAKRWPTFSEVTDKPTNYPPVAHSHESTEVKRLVGIELFFFASTAPPPGFFVLNGSTIPNGVNDYPELAASGSRFITISGNNIILKNASDFIRGKGASGRSVGEFEGDAIRNITGTLTSAHSGGAIAPRPLHSLLDSGNDMWFGATQFDASRVVPTADENRPKSLTALICIYHGEL
ncbi:hypothetical protein [Endozoicomonas acroporae]|uniref:hypothetical protein n=1 Tax=Endozoicomonas acroporae TaxID=1701104 RepID=UPI0013D2569D|nr:hypothetical protein [Endozoicomonas acroporae]